MAERITINILPPELKETKRRDRQKALIKRASISILLLMVFLTGGLLVSVVFQKNKISQATQALERTRNNASAYKEEESLAIILKSRIDGINQLAQKQYPQTEAFNLINALAPSDVRILSFAADKSNRIVLQGESTSIFSVDVFFNNLVDPGVNEGKIAKAVVESLNRNRDRLIKFDISVILTGGSSSSKPALAPPAKT